MNEIILLKLGELVLKGLNRRTFEDRLIANAKRRLRPLIFFGSMMFAPPAFRSRLFFLDNRIIPVGRGLRPDVRRPRQPYRRSAPFVAMTLRYQSKLFFFERARVPIPWLSRST